MNGPVRVCVVLCALPLLAIGCNNESASSPEAPEQAPDAAPAETKDAPPTPAPAPEPPEPPPSGHAVARVGALLFHGSTGEVGFEVPPLGEGATAPPGLTVNVVGEKDERLVVETLVSQPAEHHCAGTLAGLNDFRLRLYVGKDDLLRVVTKDFEQEFEDGTKVRVARGVTVPEAGPLVAMGTPVDASVPDEFTGLFHEPGQAFERKGSGGPVFEHEGDPLTYDGAHTLAEGSLFKDSGLGPLRYGTVTRESDALVTVRNTCLEVVARTTKDRAELTVRTAPQMARNFDPEKAAEAAGILGKMEAESGHFLASPYGAAFAVGGDDEDVWGGLTGSEVGEAFGVGGLGLVGTGRGGGPAETVEVEYSVKAGAAIVWPDGEPAGQVTADHTFDGKPRDQGGNSCFDITLTKKSASVLTLCFAPGDVAKEETEVGSGTIGLGNTGLIGKGGGGGVGSGYGRGSGAGFGGRGKRVPRVRQAKAQVKGSLDKDIIRRIVRAHINEVRYCYNQGLSKDPSLKGRVAIQYTIGPTGKVTESAVESHSMGEETVPKCIAKAVKRWKFPKPIGGGVVVVTYPFVLEPG